MTTHHKIYQAICSILRKADDEMKDKLDAEGFILPEETVDTVNQTGDDLASILLAERNALLAEIEGKNAEEILDEILPLRFLADETDVAIATLFQDTFTSFMSSLVSSYIIDLDHEASFDYFCDRTTDWINEWSEDLGKLMKLSSHNGLQSSLTTSLQNGESIDKTMRKLIDSYGFSESRARATALTEILTAHSYAKQEAILQSAVVNKKEWVHSGGHKNTPRPHHEALDGTIVDKTEKFTIHSPTGTYTCDFPRDTSLPASERVYCHCTHRGVTDSDVFGLTPEEKKAIQEQAIADDNGKWKEELIARNKAKAGIVEETIDLDWVKAKSTKEQIAYFGGVHGKQALVSSGLIEDDTQLEKLYKTITTEDGKKHKTLKTIDELKNDGILVIKQNALNHSVAGDFTTAGRPKGGGHSNEALEALEGVTITKTYSNGVKVGYCENHRTKSKRTGEGLSWFPETWTSDDILNAGTITANKPALVEDIIIDGEVTGQFLFCEVDGVTVTAIKGLDGHIKTIYPDNQQRKVSD